MEIRQLETTLVRLGIPGNCPSDLNIIASSDPSVAGNAAVYAECNKILQAQLDQRSLGPLLHVTGEMRALADPHHREICRLASRQYGMPARMVAHLPKENRTNGAGVWQWNVTNWPPQEWQNHLDAFHLLGDREVILYAVDISEDMHFSLFGDRYVLLQSHHEHDAHAKCVWFLESKTVRDALVTRVEGCFSRGKEVPARIFKEFTESLSDPLHLDLLFRLRDAGTMKLAEVTEHYRSFGTSAEELVSDLAVTCFVLVEDECVRISESGRQFLMVFSGDDTRTN